MNKYEFDKEMFVHEVCKDLRWTVVVEQNLDAMSGRIYGIWMTVMTCYMAFGFEPDEQKEIMTAIKDEIGHEFDQTNGRTLAEQLIIDYHTGGEDWLQQK